jgi:hypothetical protein
LGLPTFFFVSVFLLDLTGLSFVFFLSSLVILLRLLTLGDDSNGGSPDDAELRGGEDLESETAIAICVACFPALTTPLSRPGSCGNFSSSSSDSSE